MQYLAVCAIFRDEAPYLAEWIAFHHLVGVDHFFLYDNGSNDGAKAVLAPFIERGWVTLRPWPVPFHQHAARKAYADCLADVRGRFRWLACLDIDELLFSPTQESLTAVLPDYEQFPGVVVRWQVYGSSGQVQASDDPVIARFVHRAPTNWVRNRRVKSIVDPARAVRPVGCHHFEYADGALGVDERKQPVKIKNGFRFKKKLRPLYRFLGPALAFVDPYASRDINNSVISVDQLRINHYPIKSRQEFLRKARFKKEKRRYENIDYFAYHDRNQVFDPILHQYLPALETALSSLKKKPNYTEDGKPAH